MAIKGVKVNGITHRFDYEYLENKPVELPDVSAADSGKILTVNSSGVWEPAVVTINTGSGSNELCDIIRAASYTTDTDSIEAIESTAMKIATSPPIASVTSTYIRDAADMFTNIVEGFYGILDIIVTSATAFEYDFSMSRTGCSNTLVRFSAPNITYIYKDTFAECDRLSYVNMPLCSGVGSYAFQSCSSLLSVSLYGGCSIEAEAFCDCLVPDQKILNIYMHGNSVGYCDPAAFGDISGSDDSSESSESSNEQGGSFTGPVPGLSVFVPASLVSLFKSEWPEIYSGNIFAM